MPPINIADLKERIRMCDDFSPDERKHLLWCLNLGFSRAHRMEPANEAQPNAIDTSRNEKD